MRGKQHTPFYPPYFKARPSSSSSFPSSFSFLDASNRLQVKQVYTLVGSVEVQILSSPFPFSRSRERRAGEKEKKSRGEDTKQHQNLFSSLHLSFSHLSLLYLSFSHLSLLYLTFLNLCLEGSDQHEATAARERERERRRERERDWQKVRHVSLNGYLSPILDIPILLRACMQWMLLTP